MQLVQTRRLLGAPLTSAFTFCRFTFQRRRVTLCACEMLLPNCGPLPQTSHTCAIVLLQLLLCVFRGHPPSSTSVTWLRSAVLGAHIRSREQIRSVGDCRKSSIPAGPGLGQIAG